MTPADQPPPLDHLVGIPVRRVVRPPAADLVGSSLDGAPLDVAVTGVEGESLLLFLSSHCDGCLPLWQAWADPRVLEAAAAMRRVVAIVPERGAERLDVLAGWCASAREGRWGPGTRRLIRSDGAWSSYKVLGPPFFALVDGPAGVIVTEGVAWAAEQVAADVARAMSAQDPAAPGKG